MIDKKLYVSVRVKCERMTDWLMAQVSEDYHCPLFVLCVCVCVHV